ncbi:MAG: TIM barrel protein [Candidatus Paceibacterota bacterium]|jgi:hypothetical protein
MIRLCIPFLLTDTNQIPDRSEYEDEIFLEPNIFDGIELQKIIHHDQLDKLLQNASKFGKIKAFHFPTENADYLNIKRIERTLLETIKIIGRNKIPHLVLHSNYIQPLGEFEYSNMPETRKRFIKFYNEIRATAIKSEVVICIENLPIIGNNGDDFDSVFVFPQDFDDFDSPNIRIAWDIGHWAYTCKEFLKLSRHLGFKEDYILDFYDFIKLGSKIIRFHFSSFKNKKGNSNFPSCEEGIIPQLGHYDEKILAHACRIINDWPQDVDITLEMKETNYHKRENLHHAINWFYTNVISCQKS